MNLTEAIYQIKPINQQICEKARLRWDNIAKPLRSLGRLEEMVIQLAGIQEKVHPVVDKKAVLVFCADNGVVEEGVTQASSAVTAIVTENMIKGITSINSFAKIGNVDVMPVDIGICRDVKVDGVIQRKVSYGTKNMAKGPAMTREECIGAIEVGIQLVGELKEKGYNLILTGEMGIGNTTTSSAVLSVLENFPVEEVTGKGAGLTNDGILHKIKIIQKAIDINHPNADDPIDVLQKVGGFDLCGMVGTFIGGAVYHVPVVIDGFISAVAANCAMRLAPACEDYAFASHCSAEPAGKLALKVIRKEAYIECGMCLGEGTGAVLGAKLFDYALAAYDEIANFEEAKFGHYELLN